MDTDELQEEMDDSQVTSLSIIPNKVDEINSQDIIEDEEEIESASSTLEEENVDEDKSTTITNSDMEYKKMIDERIAKLSAKIRELKVKEARDFTGHNLNLIKGYEVELGKLQQISNAIGNRIELNSVAEAGLSILDSKREKNQETQDFYREQIKQLRAMREDLVTARSKRKIDKKVFNLNKKIQKLQRTDCFCGKIQRSIMCPKFLYESKKSTILSKAEGKVHAYEDRIHDNDIMNAELSAMSKDNLITDIRERIYDIRGTYYQKRLDRSREIFEDMQKKDSIVAMRGARITSLPKKYVDKIKQNVEEQNKDTMATSLAA